MTQTPTSTPTQTPTPSATPIICGQAITIGVNETYYYTDCCGNFITGTGIIEVPVSIDYTKPYVGLTLLNTPTSTVCPTSTPTPTPTNTSTNTPTPTQTLTASVTPTNTATPTPTPSSSSVFVLKNECEVYTSFPLGIQCEVVNQPAMYNTYDGILKINITGGTSPYNIQWDGGQNTQVLFNVPEGQYGVTVVDFYGDYTANTVCELAAPSQTPTQTPTNTPTPSTVVSCSDICLISTSQYATYGPWQFECNGMFNDKFMWSYDMTYNIVWSSDRNRWEVVDNDLMIPIEFDSGIMVSYSQEAIPLGSWVFVGGVGTPPPIMVTEGECPQEIPLQVYYYVDNSNCDSGPNCDGSIIFTAMYGNPPYLYSIDNGNNYYPTSVFGGLCPGSYKTKVKDSSDTIVNKTLTVGCY